MISRSAVLYYFSSIPTILSQLNFWVIPFIIIKKPLIIRLSNGLQFYVWNLMDIWTIKEIVLDKQYEFYNKPKKTWVVVDIGAGIGDFSIMLAPYVKQIFAFDADTNRILLSKRNVQINKCKNILLAQKEVKNISILLREYAIPRCDLLKIDCEGAEYKILHAISKTALKKIKRIVIEAHLFTDSMKKDYEKLKETLGKNNFRLIEVDNQVHDYLKFLYADRK